MRLLALLISLLFGLAVLALFLRPWEARQQRNESTAGPRQEIAVAPSPMAPPPVQQTAPAPQPAPKVLLPSQQAEAKRNEALDPQKPHAIAPAPEIKRYFKVKVRDAGTLEIEVPNAEPVVIRLDGIAARGADATCTREDGSVWPCGAKARTALMLFIRSRAVTCTLPPGGMGHEFAARCSVMNQDLATWLVRRGWATPTNAKEAGLAEALSQAKSERIGLWEAE